MMENQYGITIQNKYDLFLDDVDPQEILKQQEAKSAAKKAEKVKKISTSDPKDQKVAKAKQATKPVLQAANPEVKSEGKPSRPVKDVDETKPLRERNNRPKNKNDNTNLSEANTTTEFGVFESQPGEKRPRKGPNEPRDRPNFEGTSNRPSQPPRGLRNEGEGQGTDRPPFRDRGPREDRVFRNSDRPYRDGDRRPPRRQGFGRPEGEQNTDGTPEENAERRSGFGRRAQHEGGADDQTERRGGFYRRPPQEGAVDENGERRGGFGRRQGQEGAPDDNTERRSGFGRRPQQDGGSEDNGERRGGFGRRTEGGVDDNGVRRGGFSNRRRPQEDGVEGGEEGRQGGRPFAERRGFGGPRRGFYDDDRRFRGDRRGFGPRRSENDENAPESGERREYGYRGRGRPGGRGGFRGEAETPLEEGQQKGEFAADGESFGHWESPKDDEGGQRPYRRGWKRGRGGFGGKRDFNRHGGHDGGVKPGDKKDGGGGHNWGTTEDDLEGQTEDVGTSADAPKASWADQTEAEFEEGIRTGEINTEPSILTLDEYKALEDSKRVRAEFNIRKAGEGCAGDDKWKEMYKLEKKTPPHHEGEEEGEESEEDEDSRQSSKRHQLPIEIKFSGLPRYGGGMSEGQGGGRGGGYRGGKYRGNSRGRPAYSERGGERRGPRERAPNVNDELDFPSLGKEVSMTT